MQNVRRRMQKEEESRIREEDFYLLFTFCVHFPPKERDDFYGLETHPKSCMDPEILTKLKREVSPQCSDRHTVQPLTNLVGLPSESFRDITQSLHIHNLNVICDIARDYVMFGTLMTSAKALFNKDGAFSPNVAVRNAVFCCCCFLLCQSDVAKKKLSRVGLGTCQFSRKVGEVGKVRQVGESGEFINTQINGLWVITIQNKKNFMKLVNQKHSLDFLSQAHSQTNGCFQCSQF